MLGTVKRIARVPSGFAGLLLLSLILLLALFGPLLAPHAGDEPVGIPGSGPSPGLPLGADFLGRDVLSRVLDGGLSVVLLASAATLLIYMIGITIGLVAGYGRPLADMVLMRMADLLLSVPALLILLVLASGAGSSPTVLVIGVVLALAPGVSRIVRTATMEVAGRGFVEAAVARGERMPAVLGREILPNIVGPISADIGFRFSTSIILIASVNYLGLGLQPPASDWGLMVSENRVIISSNIWAVLVPALLIGLLALSVNLVGDAYSRTLGHSRGYD